MKYLRLLAAAFGAASCLCAMAQGGIDEIKASGQYYWAEGRGVTFDEAERDAFAAIARQINETVVSSANEGEKDGTLYSKIDIRSFAFASLDNVRTRRMGSEPDAVVFRWVDKKEVDRMFDGLAAKVEDYYNAGVVAERRLQIDDALRNYYWAYLLSRLSRPVYVEVGGSRLSCLSFLPQKINSVLALIKPEVRGCEECEGRYFVEMGFSYGGHDVASLKIRYDDGMSYQGPLSVADGMGVADLVRLPKAGKIGIDYEYRFREEGENLDAALRAAFAGTDPIAFSNHVDVPVKVDARKNTIVAARAQAAASARVAVAPEAIEEVERIEVETVGDTQPYADAMADIEKAIDGRDAAQAFGRFTPEGYKMFRTLVEDCGQVRIVRRGGPYELLKANGQVVARHCAVKVEYDDGREFMENVVFRFDPESHKVNSLAFALTKKAEDDIFNKAATWPTISRFTILQFMEDYQTAFALRRIDYLEKIFSDEALIMVGSELKVGKPTVPDSKVLSLGGKEYKFNRLSKQRYIQNLAAKFRQKEDIHLTFEDNETMIINAPSLKAFNKEGAAFAIQIRQMHSSRTYSDQGYLSLILDMSGRQPIINVRLWYPEKTGVVSLEDFISKFEF